MRGEEGESEKTGVGAKARQKNLRHSQLRQCIQHFPSPRIPHDHLYYHFEL